MFLGVMMAGYLGWEGGVVEEEVWRKGPWTCEEDKLLIEYINLHGEGRWNSVSKLAGLKRNGKSCRLRWVNYLRPDLKRGHITPLEESIIVELHARWGNRWSTIARNLPGRTDNEIKNYWRTHFKKKTKVSSDVREKAKARVLKRQQFHYHQQQQQQQQQQHPQIQLQHLQLNHFDMRKMLALLDEHISQKTESVSPPLKQDMDTFYHQTETEEASFSFSMASSNEVCSNEDVVLWDGLWNLDDVQENISQPSNASMHNLVVPFS